MSALAEFLLARIAEDKRHAGWAQQHGDWDLTEWASGVDADLGLRWGPVRVLAECDARYEVASRLRAMEAGALSRGGLDVAISELRLVCQFLALPYADHEDYREEWRP